MSETIERSCAVCGDTIEVTVYEDGSYEGGHYFGGELLDDGEYWECGSCYK
jgi:hypothetical protein